MGLAPMEPKDAIAKLTTLVDALETLLAKAKDQDAHWPMDMSKVEQALPIARRALKALSNE